MKHMDIKGAYLYADVPTKTPVGIRLPKIPRDKWSRGQIVKLKKSLFGLTQAPERWQKKPVETVRKTGTTQDVMHEGLFT